MRQQFNFADKVLTADSKRNQVMFANKAGLTFTFNLLETDTDGHEFSLYHNGEVICKVSQYGNGNYRAWQGNVKNGRYDNNTPIRAAAAYVFENCLCWFRNR